MTFHHSVFTFYVPVWIFLCVCSSSSATMSRFFSDDSSWLGAREQPKLGQGSFGYYPPRPLSSTGSAQDRSRVLSPRGEPRFPSRVSPETATAWAPSFPSPTPSPILHDDEFRITAHHQKVETEARLQRIETRLEELARAAVRDASSQNAKA